MTSAWYREHIDPSTPQFPKTLGKVNSPLIQLDSKTNELIATHESLKNYIKDNNLGRNHYAGIYNNCSGVTKTAYGFRWMWYEDWKKLNRDDDNQN
jgi:hypothetical protein